MNVIIDTGIELCGAYQHGGSQYQEQLHQFTSLSKLVNSNQRLFQLMSITCLKQVAWFTDLANQLFNRSGLKTSLAAK